MKSPARRPASPVRGRSRSPGKRVAIDVSKPSMLSAVMSPAPSKKPAPRPRPAGTFLQCMRCGHVPQGCPAMGCSKCESIGDHWAPKPMARLAESVQKAHECRRLMAEQVAAGKSARDELASVQKKNKALDREIESLQMHAVHANDVKENCEIASAVDGPETRARKGTLVQSVNERRNRVRTRIANLNERKHDANARFETAKSKTRALKSQDIALNAERENLQNELERVSAALSSHAAGNGLPADVVSALLRK